MAEETSSTPPPGGAQGTLPFRPSEHGFRFVNHFPGLPLPFTLPFKKKPATSYGLCGGMCFAAADFFRAGKPIPTQPTIPGDGSPLHAYLKKRQRESYGPLNHFALKFAGWMLLPDATPNGTQRRTYDTLALLRLLLDAGQPTVLGLVLVDGRESLALWRNHQVLAYRYTDLSETATDVYVYDPNFPGDDNIFIRTERIEVGRKKSKEGKDVPVYGVVCTEKIRSSPDKPVRGFFVISYVPKDPPEL